MLVRYTYYYNFTHSNTGIPSQYHHIICDVGAPNVSAALAIHIIIIM